MPSLRGSSWKEIAKGEVKGRKERRERGAALVRRFAKGENGACACVHLYTQAKGY